MIIDRIENIGSYYGLSERLDAGLNFIWHCDAFGLEPGRIDIEGDRVFALVQQYTPKPITEGKWEAHRKYIDIQAVFEGQEQMGYGALAGMEITEEYSEEKDVLFAEGEGNFLTVGSGVFAIFMPWDAHMPGLSAGSEEKIRKIVVKVRVS